jgi:DNA-binding transcriptional LysR family regulator
MELYQIQSFIAVANAGSLSRAAEIRNISLPGISKHIKMLEESLGHCLFTRTAKGMELTEKGEQVLEHARLIQQHVDSLTALSSQAEPIRVGLNVSPEFLQLSRLKKLVEDHYPGRNILLTNLNSDQLLDKLQRKELDLCLAFGEVATGFQKLFIHDVSMPLMVPTSRLAEIDDLGSECWIINTENCPFRIPLEQFWQSLNIMPTSTIQSQDLSRKEIVAQGMGVGFLEPHDGLYLIRTGQAKRLESHQLTVRLSVVYLDNIFQNLAELLREYISLRYVAIEPLLLQEDCST